MACDILTSQLHYFTVITSVLNTGILILSYATFFTKHLHQRNYPWGQLLDKFIYLCQDTCNRIVTVYHALILKRC